MLEVSHPCGGRCNVASEADGKFMIHETLTQRKEGSAQLAADAALEHERWPLRIVGARPWTRSCSPRL